ncbi:hypothetical protein PENSPDRAFT_569525, partial [Peniophora sp. CONT]
MNPPAEPSPLAAFGGAKAAKAQAQNLHTIVPDVQPDGTFSTPWTADRLARLKARVRERGKAGCPGLDDVATDVLLAIDNEDLANLFNDYRTIGIECAVVKWITYLIHEDAYEWAERHNIIPPEQNGFRPGYRTNNNVLLLRCLAERARAQDKTLYVVFADISNAFPSTNRDMLWVMLARMGISGRSID